MKRIITALLLSATAGAMVAASVEAWRFVLANDGEIDAVEQRVRRLQRDWGAYERAARDLRIAAGMQ